jgi:ABC-type Zn uptake system ZnuABC Zn-binding protein ZnuA
VIRYFVLALALCAAPGQAFSQEKLRVVATSADLKSLVEAVGGERVAVESLAAPEQDPHSIEVKPAQLARLRGAVLLVRIGLDHEPWLSKIKLGENLAVVDASKNIRLLQTETPRLRVERKAHAHAYGNTHYWLDPHNAQPITAAILAALATLRPADKVRFEENRDRFLSRLNEKITQWEAMVKPYRGTKAVVIHDSWPYFAERFGLNIVAAAEPTPGVPPSPAELAALFKRMHEAGVKLVIAEPHSNPSLVRQIEEKSGARAVTLAPSGSDYVALFDENLRRLAAALKSN